MTRWLKPITLGMVLALLAGCDSAGNFKSETPVTYVIKPGTWFVINENPEPTLGTEGCFRSQRELMGKLLTDVSDGPHNGCIVVRPETTSVQIKVSILGNPMELETWAVERDGTETKFRRPDGGYAVYYPRAPVQVCRLESR
jgi:hypothetical protein